MVRKSSIMIERKPLMLKDYLLDDLSSCSSNGFKSFPRRQCCSTVRFLLEIDLKQNQNHHQPRNVVKAKRLFRSRSRSFTISALQRASEAVINAVKQLPLPFPSVKSPSSVRNRARKGLLPRSLPRKLLNNRFWGKAPVNNNKGVDQELIRDNIKRWRLFPELEEHDHHHEPSDPDQNATTTKTVVAGSTSSMSSNSHSNSWCESEFTSSSSGQSESSAHENDVVGVALSENDMSQKVNRKVDITVGEETTELGPTTTTCSENAKEWPNEGDKEQFSPVSVLDCPFEDDDQDESATSSPFNRRLTRLEGTKQKLLQKIRRFENLTQLEPVDLEKRIIAMSELEDDHKGSNGQDRPLEEDKKARELVAKLTTKAITCTDNKLLIDFFRERLEEEREWSEEAAMKAAEEWAMGAPTREVVLGWEVREGRRAYVTDIERGGRWRNLDKEKGEIGLELEALVWNSLMEELLLHFL